MNVFRQKSWSPYVAGALAGLVLCLSVLVAGKYLGASTTYVRVEGLIEKALSPERVAGMEYYVKTKIKVDWQMLFVVGIVFGALLASTMGRDFKLTAVPPMWRDNFGPGKNNRFLAAFVGGAVAMFGARMAGGCPTGHGLSGLSQMSISGYIAIICFFGAGIITAKIIYRKGV